MVLCAAESVTFPAIGSLCSNSSSAFLSLSPTLLSLLSCSLPLCPLLFSGLFHAAKTTPKDKSNEMINIPLHCTKKALFPWHTSTVFQRSSNSSWNISYFPLLASPKIEITVLQYAPDKCLVIFLHVSFYNKSLPGLRRWMDPLTQICMLCLTFFTRDNLSECSN